MSSLLSLSQISNGPGGFLDNLLVIVYFFLGTCRTLKSNIRIYTNYLTIRELGKSVANRFNYITKVLVSNLTIKWTLYSYARTFLSALSKALYSSFLELYLASALFQIPLLYRARCRFLVFGSSYIKHEPQPFKEASTTNIRSYPDIKSISNSTSAVINFIYSSAIVFYYSYPQINGIFFQSKINKGNIIIEKPLINTR